MLGSFASKIGGASLKVAKFGAAISAVSFASFVIGVKSAFTEIDKIAKTASQLGLKFESLQAIQMGASLGGASAEKLTSGLQRFVRELPAGADVLGSLKGCNLCGVVKSGLFVADLF